MSQLLPKQPTTKIFGVSSNDLTSLATAVDTKMSALNATLVNPGFNSTTGVVAAAGPVINGSIQVSDINQMVVNQGILYLVTIKWLQQV